VTGDRRAPAGVRHPVRASRRPETVSGVDTACRKQLRGRVNKPPGSSRDRVQAPDLVSRRRKDTPEMARPSTKPDTRLDGGCPAG